MNDISPPLNAETASACFTLKPPAGIGANETEHSAPLRDMGNTQQGCVKTTTAEGQKLATAEASAAKAASKFKQQGSDMGAKQDSNKAMPDTEAAVDAAGDARCSPSSPGAISTAAPDATAAAAVEDQQAAAAAGDDAAAEAEDQQAAAAAVDDAVAKAEEPHAAAATAEDRGAAAAGDDDAAKAEAAATDTPSSSNDGGGSPDEDAAAAAATTTATDGNAEQGAPANPAAAAAAAAAGSAAAGAGASAAAAAAVGAGAGAGVPHIAEEYLHEVACTPGTPEFEAAAAIVRTTLTVYKARTQLHLSQGRAKPDMIAYKELRAEHTPKEKHGHIPGVKVGAEFLGRGELAIIGLHTQMMRGIMALKGKPAYAIAMSGGYKDDADTGSTFWYTGQGGQKKQSQVADQSYDSPDNAALVAACDAGVPVRVFRGKIGPNQERLYVYEGLYQVAEHKQEPSKDGPQVIKFKMVGIPGHSVVSSTVEFKCLTNAAFQTVLLAQPPPARAGRKRGRAPELQLPSRDDIVTSINQRAASGRHGRLVTADLSEGQERVPIPVWNALDDDDRILITHQGPEDAAAGEAMQEDEPGFDYISDYKFGEEAAKDLAIQAEKAFSDGCKVTCGIRYSGGGRQVNYTADGLMMCTQPCGLMECDEGCRGSAACAANRIVGKGIRYPLEVFKVSPQKGWGVRCAMNLPIGAVICCYIGLVITDEWADQLRNQDLYLFDLNHFHLLAEAGEADDVPDMPLNPNLPQLEGDMKQKHLVIDAHRQGNVGRFINHSCSPNCLVQTVFAGNARSQLLYYIAIVASRDIPAYTELTYDYNYANKAPNQGDADAGEGAGVRIPCTCGSDTCTGRLI